MYEFTHISNMMKEDKETFVSFVNDMISKSPDYLKLVNVFDPEIKFIQIDFYELDGDEYDYPVFRWGVEFSPKWDKNLILFRGYNLNDIYRLENNDTKLIDIEGDYDAIIDFVNQEKFQNMSQEEIDIMYTTHVQQIDHISEWIGNIEGFECNFEPDGW